MKLIHQLRLDSEQITKAWETKVLIKIVLHFKGQDDP